MAHLFSTLCKKVGEGKNPVLPPRYEGEKDAFRNLSYSKKLRKKRGLPWDATSASL